MEIAPVLYAPRLESFELFQGANGAIEKDSLLTELLQCFAHGDEVVPAIRRDYRHSRKRELQKRNLF